VILIAKEKVVKGKNKEIRIAILVVILLFLIVIWSSLWTSPFSLLNDDASQLTEVDVETAHLAVVEELQQAAGEHHQLGKSAVNNKLLSAEAYRAAAEQGDVEAQFKMGEAYSNGRIVPTDATAIIWYRKSAQKGYGPAQNRLGVIYQHTGKAPYQVIAFALYRLAAFNASSPSAAALEHLKRLKAKMPTKDINAGEALATKLEDLESFLRVLDQAVHDAQAIKPR
jgi:hypothetical protein